MLTLYITVLIHQALLNYQLVKLNEQKTLLFMDTD